MNPRTLLGFDYGSRRIGVAVGQELTATARPLETLPCRNGQPDWPALGRLITTWQPDALVVGMPATADGTETPFVLAAQRFTRQLHGRFGLPVYTSDERLSSREAERQLSADQRRNQPGLVDRLAAQVILQAWLDSQRTASLSPYP